MTFSIRAADLTKRYDYVLPCALLFSNVASGQVFRTDLLTNPPPSLLASDSETASDHLPVLMVFNNPYEQPFRLLATVVSNDTVTLSCRPRPGGNTTWRRRRNRPARWQTLASNLTAVGATLSLATNASERERYFRVLRVP